MLKNSALRLLQRECGRVLATRGAAKDVIKTTDGPIKPAAAGQPHPVMVSLGNDIRVACFSNDSEISSTAIHVNAGTRHETEENNGVSNLIARLAGKGTTSTKIDDMQMKLSKMGASLDVNVSREITSFIVTGFSKDSIEHANIVSEVVKSSVFDESALNKERDAILIDIARDQDNISQVVMDYLYKVAYEGTAMGRTLTGSTSNIESLGRKDIMSFIEMNYKAPRMVLTSVGGQVDLDKLAETAERNLGGMKNLTERNVDSEYYPKHFTELSGQSKDGVGYQQNPQQLLQQQDLLPCRFTAMEVQHRDDDLPLAHVAMGFNSCSYNSPDRIPLMLLAEVMGAHDKSHGGLGQGLNTMGAAVQNPQVGLYSIAPFAHFYSDCGMFGNYYVADPMNLYDAGLYVCHYWRDQCLNLIDSRLVRAKRVLKRKLIEDMYSMPAIQGKLAQDIFFGLGRPEALEETIDTIEKLNVDQVQEVAVEYLRDQEFARAAYGPTEGVFDYNQSMDALRGYRW